MAVVVVYTFSVKCMVNNIHTVCQLLVDTSWCQNYYGNLHIFFEIIFNESRRFFFMVPAKDSISFVDFSDNGNDVEMLSYYM